MNQTLSEQKFDSSTTIVVICYNSAAYIRRCLETILAATPRGTPIIVIDNASRDATLEIVRTVAPNCQIFALQRNIGHSAACNLALHIAKTTWVLLQDHDTYVAHDWFAPLLRAAARTWTETALVSRMLLWLAALTGLPALLIEPQVLKDLQASRNSQS
ncbi:MAG: glycosyltransferase [Chloroflexia bacterium]|nr:glycosyltransferase [Chloroflexia bacterium]